MLKDKTIGLKKQNLMQKATNYGLSAVGKKPNLAAHLYAHFHQQGHQPPVVSAASGVTAEASDNVAGPNFAMQDQVSDGDVPDAPPPSKSTVAHQSSCPPHSSQTTWCLSCLVNFANHCMEFLLKLHLNSASAANQSLLKLSLASVSPLAQAFPPATLSHPAPQMEPNHQASTKEPTL